jgi:L-threonylcarbamoyladenylate synthase
MRNDIQKAVQLLRQGELVAFPTETVYGLGADALNVQAVARIFAAKERPADHPLIVHLPLNSDLGRWAREVPAAADKLAFTFWPGPLTLILKRQRRLPDIVTGGQDTVGLRVPDHPVARELLAHFASGIAAPSANRFGRISPTTAEHVRQELGDRVSRSSAGRAASASNRPSSISPAACRASCGRARSAPPKSRRWSRCRC